MNSNTPISEQYRLAAQEWSAANTAASMLEESKTSVLSQRIKALGDIPHNRAERDVKASPAWQEYITSMVNERGRANLLKVKLEYIRMKFQEWNSANADKRVEMRL